jgi:hypothetical protein
MYAVAESRATVGSVISRDNCQLWVKAIRDDHLLVDTTPASDEAMQFEEFSEASELVDRLGDWWAVVDLEDEDD